MKIAVYFGSFNPVHNGHLMIANYVKEFTDVQQVVFMVSPQSPFKSDDLIPAKHRLKMLSLALQGSSGYSVSNLELTLPLPSYTYRTLQILRQSKPDVQWVVLMGGDNLPGLPKWKNFEEILYNHEVFVYPRPGFEKQKLEPIIDQYRERFSLKGIRLIDAPLLEISATFIRQSIKQGKDVSFFMPVAVAHYISAHKLYN